MMSHTWRRLVGLAVLLALLPAATWTQQQGDAGGSAGKLLLYNTTSGVYQAELVRIDVLPEASPEYSQQHQPAFVHRLISVPYGEMPERFQQAVLRKYEPGVHAIQDYVACYQYANMTSYGQFQIRHAPRMVEDCLVANIYIPVDVDEQQQKLKDLPVVVHVHGGSNMVGGASLFDGSVLAAHGRIVVIMINYRLGILGFLSDMTKNYPGNYGLRDQILAIKWIKMNCHVFNCNPNKITLWGHSAGAGDVNWLSLSPYSNHLFQRVIIQSGSALSYWALDKLPFERYSAFRTFFNCTYLPEQHTAENQAMTMLIEKCLRKVPLSVLYSFKFALIDAPAPVSDESLGKQALISVRYSGKEMIEKNFPINLDIMTGINAVEGFAFEGFFSSSVRFWSSLNVTNELFITLERFSLLVKETCIQNTLIHNRHNIDRFYNNLSQSILRKNLDANHNTDLVRRLKSIFFNAHTIFDSGFIDFVKALYNMHANSSKGKAHPNNNMYVYEYLHENIGIQTNLNEFKRILRDDFQLSTHFDGIDFMFGLPIGFKLRQIRKSLGRVHREGDEGGVKYPFDNFIFDNQYQQKDVDLSYVFMTYFANFIKTGNPNVGQRVSKVWIPYVPRKAYFKFNSNLTSKKKSAEDGDIDETDQISFDIRNDLYEFYTNQVLKSGNCEAYDAKTNPYDKRNHTRGKDPAIDACIGRLADNKEYMSIKDNFLIQYEKCVADYEQNPIYRNMFVTFCLDILVVRRILIEYKTCCVGDDKRITSTVCSFANFDRALLDLKVDDLIEYAKNSTTLPTSPSPDSGGKTEPKLPTPVKSTAAASIMSAGTLHSLALFVLNILVILVVYLIR